MYQVIFYEDRRGHKPVQEYLGELSLKSREKVLRSILFLENEGPFLRRPHADKVRDKIYELRVRFADDQIRIFYFFINRDQIILLHVIRKKTNAIPERELHLAEVRMRDYQTRFENENSK